MDDPLGEAELPDISPVLRDVPVELVPIPEEEPELMPEDEPEPDLMPLSIEPQAESAKAHAKGIVHLIIRFS
jgi:hypothetical protein